MSKIFTIVLSDGTMLEDCVLDEDFSSKFSYRSEEGNYYYSDGTIIYKDGTIESPEGKTYPPNGLVKDYEDGSLLLPCGFFICDTGKIYKIGVKEEPQSYEFDDGSSLQMPTGDIISPDGKSYEPNTLVYDTVAYKPKEELYQKPPNDNDEWTKFPSVVTKDDKGFLNFPNGDRVSPNGMLYQANGSVIQPKYNNALIFDPDKTWEENCEIERLRAIVRDPGKNTTYDYKYDLGGSEAKRKDVVDAYNANIAYRDKFEADVIDENDFSNYQNERAIYDSMFTEKAIKDVYGDYDTYGEYLDHCSPELSQRIKEAKDEAESTGNVDVLTKLLDKIISDIEYWMSSVNLSIDADLMQNSVMIDYIMEYLRKLLDMFKAYTTQFKDITLLFTYYDPLNETVKIREEYMLKPLLPLADYLKLRDKLTRWKGILPYKDVLKIHDRYFIMGKFSVWDSAEITEQLNIHGLFTQIDRVVFKEALDFFDKFSFKDIVFFKDKKFILAKFQLWDSAEVKEDYSNILSKFDSIEKLDLKEALEIFGNLPVKDVLFFRDRLNIPMALLPYEENLNLDEYFVEFVSKFSSVELLAFTEEAKKYVHFYQKDLIKFRDKIKLGDENFELVDETEVLDKHQLFTQSSSTNFLATREDTSSNPYITKKDVILFRDAFKLTAIEE